MYFLVNSNSFLKSHFLPQHFCSKFLSMALNNDEASIRRDNSNMSSIPPLSRLIENIQHNSRSEGNGVPEQLQPMVIYHPINSNSGQGLALNDASQMQPRMPPGLPPHDDLIRNEGFNREFLFVSPYGPPSGAKMPSTSRFQSHQNRRSTGSESLYAGNSNSQYHSVPLVAAPLTYQFPPPTIPIPPPVNGPIAGNSISYEPPAQTYITQEFTNYVASLDEVYSGINLLKSKHNELLYSTLVDGARRTNGPDDQELSEAARNAILSIHPSVLHTLILHTRNHLEFYNQLRSAQARLSVSLPRPHQAHRHKRHQSEMSQFSAELHRGSHQGKSKSDTLIYHRPEEFEPRDRRKDKNPNQHQFSSKSNSKNKLKSPTSCDHCGSRTTPEWRRGPNGDKTVCNACGIFFSKLIRKYHSPIEASRIMSERKAKGKQTDRHV